MSRSSSSPPPERPVTSVPGGIRLALHVQPRAARTELAGLHGNALKVRLAAPPVDGAANAELLAFLARQLGVPRSALALRQGATSRRKVVEAAGLTAAEAARRLALGSG